MVVTLYPRIRPLPISTYPRTQCKGKAMQKGMPINKQATSKIWSLYTFDGFLPSSYIRDLVKITKVTDIKQGILEEYIWI